MILSEEKQNPQPKNGLYPLIQGTFSPEEATEIINGLFAKKISFHHTKSFSQLIRFGSKDPNAPPRINELKESQQHANALIAIAQETGKSLRVQSTISIELI